MPIPPAVRTIVQHIARHLRVHPQACDTPEGIARWWTDIDDPVPVAAVEAALDGLIAAAAVEAQPVAVDGRVRYRRAAVVSDERLAAIEHDPGVLWGNDPPHKGWH